MSLLAAWAAACLWSAPSPEFPGVDVRDLGPAWGDTLVHENRVHAASVPVHGIGSWAAPPVDEQLAADEVLVGMGEGALFVPTMTHGRLEPRITVLDSTGRVVALGSSGTRLRVVPGSYRIRFGSGAEDQRLEIPATVTEGNTTVVPVPWAGLTVSTINPERLHVRGDYKLVRIDRFQAYGEGFGQTEDRLADISTWILPPGVYRITGLAAGADDLTNFVTVRLMPGEWIEYTLVMDGDKVVGGGMLPQAITASRSRTWRFGADLGGSASWTREKLVRQSNLRTTTSLTGYSQLRVRREKDAWLATGSLQYVGGSALAGAEGRWKIAPDELTAQLFVVRRVTPRIGPYGRIVGTSHLFPADVDLSTDADPLRLWLRDPSSGRLGRAVEGGQSWEYAAPFAPLELREGLGFNVEALQRPALEISLQAGLASRQVFPLGAWYQRDLESPSLAEELRALDSTADVRNSVVMERLKFEHGTGLEAAGSLLARLGSSASITATPGLFRSLWPTDRLELSMTTVLSLHFTRFFSADFRHVVKRSLEEDAIHRYPYSFQTLLRFSFGA